MSSLKIIIVFLIFLILISAKVIWAVQLENLVYDCLPKVKFSEF